MAVGDEANEARVREERLALLEATVAERDAKMAARDAKVAEQAEKIAEQAEKIAEQAEKIAKLTEQVATLTELLSRNSKNSHLPPSSDGPGSGSRGGVPGKSRTESGRPRGGQKGRAPALALVLLVATRSPSTGRADLPSTPKPSTSPERHATRGAVAHPSVLRSATQSPMRRARGSRGLRLTFSALEPPDELRNPG